MMEKKLKMMKGMGSFWTSGFKKNMTHKWNWKPTKTDITNVRYTVSIIYMEKRI